MQYYWAILHDRKLHNKDSIFWTLSKVTKMKLYHLICSKPLDSFCLNSFFDTVHRLKLKQGVRIMGYSQGIPHVRPFFW